MFLKFWVNQLHKTKIGTKLMRLFGVLYYLTIVLTTREHFLCPHACTTPALACVVDGMMTESLGSVGALSLSQTDGPSIGMKRSAVVLPSTSARRDRKKSENHLQSSVGAETFTIVSTSKYNSLIEYELDPSTLSGLTHPKSRTR